MTLEPALHQDSRTVCDWFPRSAGFWRLKNTRSATRCKFYSWASGGRRRCARRTRKAMPCVNSNSPLRSSKRSQPSQHPPTLRSGRAGPRTTVSDNDRQVLHQSCPAEDQWRQSRTAHRRDEEVSIAIEKLSTKDQNYIKHFQNKAGLAAIPIPKLPKSSPLATPARSASQARVDAG